jgi:hypothetical protein
MIWLTSKELVDVVRRTLVETVVPAIDDEFARVQAVAAAHALLEVSERLAEGDPVTTDTDALTALLEGCGRRGIEASGDARADNAAAREEISRAIAEAGTGAGGALLSDLRSVESALAREDSRWICREAMATLE